jgi:hypothetical protein
VKFGVLHQEEGTVILPNVDDPSPKDTAPYIRRTEPAAAQHSERPISFTRTAFTNQTTNAFSEIIAVFFRKS